MKKSAILLIALFVQFLVVFGQELPVSWQFKAVPVSDDETELQFTAKIKDGWHLFSQYHHSIELPTVFTFKESDSYARIGKVSEPKCIISYDPVFQDTSKYFEKFVTFKQRIKVKSADAFQVKGNGHRLSVTRLPCNGLYAA